MAAFVAFCPTGKCVQEALAAPVGTFAGQVFSNLNEALNDSPTRNVVSEFVDDLQDVVPANLSSLQALS